MEITYQAFQEDWGPEDIAVFNSILVTVKKSQQHHIHISAARLERTTRFGRVKVENALDRLKEKAFIIRSSSTLTPYGYEYLVDVNAIVTGIDTIYDFSFFGSPERSRKFAVKYMKDFVFHGMTAEDAAGNFNIV